MKYVLTIIMVLALAIPAFAGQNPNVTGYISFDAAGDPGVNVLTPTAYTAISAYVCFGNISETAGEGLKVVSFALNDVMVDCPGVMGSQAFTNLLDLAIGDPYDGVGITLSSIACRPGPIVVVGRIDCFFLAGGCCFELVDHADYPLWVVDCQEPGVVDYYTLISHGQVNDGECEPITPVQETTWGSLKAMYQ